MTSSPRPNHLTETLLATYDVPEEVRQGIAEAGFLYATPIQAKALPIALAGRDVAGQAQTGTGKTAAFLITIFTRLMRRPRKRPGRGPRALVIAPTRELVVQIRADAQLLGRHTGVTTLAVYGGIDYRRQKEALRGVRRILRRCPPYNRRQTMLFSATLSPRVMELAWEHTNNAEKVEIEPERVGAHGISEILYHVSSAEKFRLLLGLLEREGGERVLIFVNRRTTAMELVRGLSANGYPARALAGNVPQEKRLKIVNEFKDGKLPILVATDVASRGLHIEGVSHVVNYDLPQDAEDYVHRIGRTGRAGALGTAVSLACDDYVFSLDSIQKLIGRQIPVLWAPEEIVEKGRLLAEARPRRPVATRRPSARPSAPKPVTYGREKRKSR